MAEAYWGQQFEDENTRSRYPFADSSTLTSQDTLVRFGDGVFVDASVYPIGVDAGIYLASADVANRAVTLVFGTGARPALCSTTFDPLNPPATLPLEDAFGRPAGLLACDPTALAAAQTWPIGVHPFDAAAAPLVASCTIALPASCLRGLLVGTAAVAGDVWIVGTDGVAVTEDAGSIRVDVVGDPLSVRRLCAQGGAFTPPAFVRTINGNPPDQFGNFHITVADGGVPDTILRVNPAPPDAIMISAVGKAIAG